MILCCCWPALLPAQDPVVVPFSYTLSWSPRPEPQALFGPAAAATAFVAPAGAVSGTRPFGLQALGCYQFAAVFPVDEGRFTAGAALWTSPALQRLFLGAGYARNLGALSAGLRLHYLRWQSGAYGSASTVSSELGLLIEAGPELRVGFNLLHPLALRWGKSGERLGRVLAAGLGWQVSEQVFTGFTVRKEEGTPPGVEALVQYAPVPAVAVHLGLNTTTAGLLTGARFRRGSWLLSLNFSWHPRLGGSPFFLIGYQKQDL